jgi:hypothetical protein
MKLLHIAPHHFQAPGFAEHGSTKDILGRREYLAERGIDNALVRFNRKTGDIAQALSAHAADRFTHILVDASVDEPVWRWLRQRWPEARLALRSHNSEIPHRRDAVRALREWPYFGKLHRALKNNIEVFGRRDVAAAAFADDILTIESGQAAQRYWRRLGFKGQVGYAPYFVASGYARRIAQARAAGPRSDRRILCVLSAHPGPVTDDSLIQFMRFVSAAGDDGAGWRFEAAGATSREISEHRSFTPDVRRLGVVDDLVLALCGASAMAALSDLGRGFKTKVLDAVLCGCWVLASPRLAARLPEELQPYCIVVDPKDSVDVRAALLKLRQPPPVGDPNAALKIKAFEALDRFFLEKPAI